MSNKSRKNKSSQSPKQEPERASEKAMRESKEDMKTEAKLAVEAVVENNPKARMQDADFSFETKAAEVKNTIIQIVDGLQSVANTLNTETIFGIPAARFQAYADKIKKYPKQLKNKAAKERRRLTDTESKEEKKEKKAKALRERIQALQTKLAKL